MGREGRGGGSSGQPSGQPAGARGQEPGPGGRGLCVWRGGLGNDAANSNSVPYYTAGFGSVEQTTTIMNR